MSGNTVFYAWQSDLPEKCNHYFIRDAADIAIRELKSELAVDEAPRLDHDTKGVPGIPDIARTIFDKIGSCTVFLADVSSVGSTEPPEGREAKLLPNPNVMIELGYALREVSHERIILIMNTAFGGPEHLPFDLRTRRHPIKFELAGPDDPKRKTVLAELAGNLKNAIRAIIEYAPPMGRAAEEEGQRQAASLARMARERESFRATALQGQFNGFTPEKGALLLSLIPERPLSPRLNFSDRKLQNYNMAAIGGSAQRPNLHARKLVVVDSHGQAQDKPFAATELRDDGVIFAADGFLLSQDATVEIQQKVKHRRVVGLIPSLAYENKLAHSVATYLHLQREFGVQGPVHVSFALYRIQGFVMAVNRLAMHLAREIRVYEGDGIVPDPVIFLEDTKCSTWIDVAKHMRSAFDHVWLDFGHPRSLNFDEAGEWRHEDTF